MFLGWVQLLFFNIIFRLLLDYREIDFCNTLFIAVEIRNPNQQKNKMNLIHSKM